MLNYDIKEKSRTFLCLWCWSDYKPVKPLPLISQFLNVYFQAVFAARMSDAQVLDVGIDNVTISMGQCNGKLHCYLVPVVLLRIHVTSYYGTIYSFSCLRAGIQSFWPIMRLWCSPRVIFAGVNGYSSSFLRDACFLLHICVTETLTSVMYLYFYTVRIQRNATPLNLSTSTNLYLYIH